MIRGGIILLAALSGTALWARAADSADSLDQARRLVEQKQYSQALTIYESIGPWLREDADRLIEWARVNTYADRHATAIELFEHVRLRYPQRSGEILRELGDQYTWHGQLPKAIDVYRQALQRNENDLPSRLGLARALVWGEQFEPALVEYTRALQQDPSSVPAINGKANVLSRTDRLEEAYDLYGRALARDPQNLDALNGRARVRVWQGYHRKGLAQYRDILRSHPQDPDAIEGQAFAQHWEGRDDLAVQTLEDLLCRNPDRVEAGKLLQHIKNARKPVLSQYDRYTADRNDLSVQTHGIHGGGHIDELTMLEGVYEWQRFRQDGQTTVDASRGGIGLSRRLNDWLSAQSYVYGTDFAPGDFHPVTTNTWLTFQPDDVWRVDVAYDRETFEDIQAIEHHIIADSGSISVDFRPDRFWFFAGRYKYSKYSDENVQNSFLGKAEYRFSGKPFAKLYYNYYFSDWTRQMNHGYYNPDVFQAHTLGVYSSAEVLPKLFVEGQASVGYEIIKPPSEHPTWYLAGGLVYRATENWAIALRGEYFRACPDANSDGYWRKGVFLTVTYNFGEVGRPIPSAAQPARPTP